MVKLPDFFSDENYALGVGNFRVTGDTNGTVQLTFVKNGTTQLFNVPPDVAFKIAEAITSVATCVKYSKD